MIGTSKRDVLETLLTEMARAQTGGEAGPSADDDAALAGKVIILTILSKLTQSMPGDELMKRSELTTDQFERIVAYLVHMRWVETHNSGFRLTGEGREAAEQERKRLLRFG